MLDRFDFYFPACYDITPPNPYHETVLDRITEDFGTEEIHHNPKHRPTKYKPEKYVNAATTTPQKVSLYKYMHIYPFFL